MMQVGFARVICAEYIENLRRCEKNGRTRIHGQVIMIREASTSPYFQ
jgi:hypothetical protein